jgi:large conductance mechanosensitive channel
MWKEFKEFAMGGNVLDLAVGLVIGAAFGKLPTSFVDNLIMPFVSLLGGSDFKTWAYPLKEAVTKEKIVDDKVVTEVVTPAITWKYGQFLDDVIMFLITAFAIFLVVKQINKWRNKEIGAAVS